MMTQEEIVDCIGVAINSIQLSPSNQKKIQKDKSRRSMLQLREDIIRYLDELKSIYWARQDSIKDGLLPIQDTGEDEEIWGKIKEAKKKMLDLNSDIALGELENGMATEYSCSN